MTALSDLRREKSRPNKLIALLYESLADLDRSVAGLSPEDATARHDGHSSIAWTVGHVTNMLDAWIVGRFAGLPLHPVLSDPKFRRGGGGEADSWPAIRSAVSEVHELARRFLESEQAADLERLIPYDGSIDYLRPVGLSLRYALMRIAAHHFVHVGEIVTIRSRLGHRIEDFPGWGQALV